VAARASLAGFVRLYGGAVGAVLLGFAAGVVVGRVGVSVDEVAGLDVGEAVAAESLFVLCFQQSAGDSAGPEVDVPLAFVGDGRLDGDVGDLDASAGAEDAGDLGEDGVFVGDEVDDAV
jgi:hypothetical protein